MWLALTVLTLWLALVPLLAVACGRSFAAGQGQWPRMDPVRSGTVRR